MISSWFCVFYFCPPLPPLGGRTPPMSPHRTNEVRMTEEQVCGGWGPMSTELSSLPSFLRRESDFVTADIISRSRGGSSSSSSSVFVESPQTLPRGFGTTSAYRWAFKKQQSTQTASFDMFTQHNCWGRAFQIILYLFSSPTCPLTSYTQTNIWTAPLSSLS